MRRLNHEPGGKQLRILVVGAGLAGATYARTLAEAGCRVVVVDRRSHIAGNAYDEVDRAGIRVHKYGPHLFHTSNKHVINWINRFSEWITYRHRVRALLPSGELVPLPINLDTLNVVFDKKMEVPAEAQQLLQRLSVTIDKPRNAAEFLASKIGVELRELFFRPYTKKMWNLDLEELSADVVKRIPLRFDHNDEYFPLGETQMLPRGGYTRFVANILDHPGIEVFTGTRFMHKMMHDFDHNFLSIPIDEYYGFSLGQLPYRSLKFHTRLEQNPIQMSPWSEPGGFSVINFTDASPFTRETAWHRLPEHIVFPTPRLPITKEEPCNYEENNFERYYPISDAQGHNRSLYARYCEFAERDSASVTFIGRCGTYRYLDMDQVINQSLVGCKRWLQIRARK